MEVFDQKSCGVRLHPLMQQSPVVLVLAELRPRHSVEAFQEGVGGGVPTPAVSTQGTPAVFHPGYLRRFSTQGTPAVSTQGTPAVFTQGTPAPLC